MKGQRWWGTGEEGAHHKVVAGRCTGRGCPAHPAVLQHKGSAGNPASGHGNPSAGLPARNPETLPIPGAHQRAAGVTGGQQWEGGPQAYQEPQAALLMLDLPEEMPQSSQVIFWVNRVSFDLGFKMWTPFQGANEETLKDSWGRRGKGFSWPVLLWHRLDVLQ